MVTGSCKYFSYRFLVLKNDFLESANSTFLLALALIFSMLCTVQSHYSTKHHNVYLDNAFLF